MIAQDCIWRKMNISADQIQGPVNNEINVRQMIRDVPYNVSGIQTSLR